MAFAVDLTGSILDRRYRITGLLGRGGMGYVYDAMHMALDHRVAVKVLHPRYAYEQRFRERFLQEARAASKIRHRNVVEIKDFGETPDDSVYFVMEYLDGHDVGFELKQHGVLPWSRTRGILLQAASALHAAHLKEIIHRDIKPGNCFLTRGDDGEDGDRVKLLDFGIAKVGSDQHADAQGKGLTGTGEVFGTASYMAPEQARGEQLDARSDMYSLGIMAYEMLTGEVPFTGINAIHVITRHLNDPPEPLRSLVPEIPAAVESVVLRMIAKDAKDRYPSMAAVERALEGIPEDAAERGQRRTRLWGTDQDLRALVEEKKAAAGKGVVPPVRAGAKEKTAVLAGRAGADAERTQMVTPGTAGAGGVKKTVVETTRGAGDGGGAKTVVETTRGTGDGGGARPGSLTWGSAAATVARGSGLPLEPACVVPPVERAPVESSFVVPPPPAFASMAGAPTVVEPSVAAPHPVPMAAPMSAPDRGMDGTYPPPGLGVDTNPSGRMWPSWQSTNAGTGPLDRVADTGSEISPQVPVVGEGQGVSLRMLFVVGVLVILVGAASVGGTLTVLSSQAGAKEVREVGTEDAAAEAEAELEGVELGGGATVPVPGGMVVSEGVGESTEAAGEGLERGASDDGETDAMVGVTGSETETEPVAVDEAAEEDLGEIVLDEDVVPPPASGKPGPAAPKVPSHETEKCARVRADADAALGKRKWAELARLAADKKCWPSAKQVDRRSMHVMALLEDGRFEACVKAGKGASDRQTEKMVGICRSKVQ
ncbi:serine/threonine-protein kinase [Paraliomyxa miuraensis]|uniref:serine/threonine-protein kinase n=1 Tax=Paraliomyxa miuraensis TaxID=376150 RepID=UPI0022579A0B|nr:serine/threonine-protein kinase [Paraliomyxa miuraensis]MCX4247882.1 protein kinase [Paraliomyxa miuraensis]